MPGRSLYLLHRAARTRRIVFMLNWFNWFTGRRGLNERRSCLRETEPRSAFVFGLHVPSPPSQWGIQPISASQAVGQDPHQQSCWIINATPPRSENKPEEVYNYTTEWINGYSYLLTCASVFFCVWGIVCWCLKTFSLFTVMHRKFCFLLCRHFMCQAK